MTVSPSEPSSPLVVPELDVSDLDASVEFYVSLIGFVIVFRRNHERFVYLDRRGVSVMLQEAAGPGRRFRTAPLERPFGRGVNLQAAASDVAELYERVTSAGVEPVVPLEQRWYEVDVEVPCGRWTVAGPAEAGNEQFVIADPDGYLWRFFRDLGVRPRSSTRAPSGEKSSH